MTAAESPDTPLCAPVAAANAGDGATEPENTCGHVGITRYFRESREITPAGATVSHTIQRYCSWDCAAKAIGSRVDEHGRAVR